MQWKEYADETPQHVTDLLIRMLAENSKAKDAKGNPKFRGLREHDLYRSILRSKGVADI